MYGMSQFPLEIVGGLTQRALDKWESARFQAVCVA